MVKVHHRLDARSLDGTPRLTASGGLDRLRAPPGSWILRAPAVRYFKFIYTGVALLLQVQVPGRALSAGAVFDESVKKPYFGLHPYRGSHSTHVLSTKGFPPYLLYTYFTALRRPTNSVNTRTTNSQSAA